jgi:hypothetical protein
MREQKVVRTYPKGYANETRALQEALSQGFCVVMANKFDINGSSYGTEYIVEREHK